MLYTSFGEISAKMYQNFSTSTLRKNRYGSGQYALGLLVFFSAKDSHHIWIARSLSALLTTDTELKLMAAAAIIGESSSPKTG